MDAANLPTNMQHAGFPTGTCISLINVPGVGTILAYGTTVPADNAVGFAPSCLFIHVDGSAGSALYCNEGTALLANFDVITVA